MKKLTTCVLFPVFIAASIFSCSLESDNYYDGGGYYGHDDISGEKYDQHDENQFMDAGETPVSTFSVDSDGASYSNMRRFVNSGQRPLKASVRIEEYLNYFTFDYPEPDGGHNISLNNEMSVCPWNEDHLLMRIGIKGKTVPQEELSPTNYVFLIDVSGSMGSSDKLALLKEGFIKLVDVLDAKDRIAIVTYAGTAGVRLPSTSCDNKDIIKNAISGLKAGGSTAGGEGIVKAYQIAEQNYIPDGNNRIIIGSDGDFNVGPVSDKELVELIKSRRDKGIYLTVLGVGSGNLNDSMMEKLANNGNGTYEYIDNAAQMDKVFIHERSKFHTIAKDCKIQVTFNPEVVSKYRLIGYENRMLNKEDFEDDKKDAGEIGVGQTVTAIYEIIPAESAGTGMAASLEVRYKQPVAEVSRLMEDEILFSGTAIADASESMRFAAAVAGYGMILRESEFSGNADRDMIVSLAESATTFDPHGYRNEFIGLVKECRLP